MYPAPLWRKTIVANPSETPYASDFGTATRAIGTSYSGDISSSDTSWQFYTVEEDSLWVNGGSSWPPPNIYVCAEPILRGVMPFGYGQIAQSISSCEYFGAAYNGPVLQGCQVVATGTIQYQGGVIPNVVLVRDYVNGVGLNSYGWCSTSNMLVSLGGFLNGKLYIYVPTTALNIPEQHGATILRMYPQPASQIVEVQFSSACDDDDVEFQVIDAIGRRVISGRTGSLNGQLHLDISSVPNGNFVLRLKQGIAEGFGRLIVMH